MRILQSLQGLAGDWRFPYRCTISIASIQIWSAAEQAIEIDIDVDIHVDIDITFLLLYSNVLGTNSGPTDRVQHIRKH